MLQAEKAKLVAAIQACEAATACVSRPGKLFNTKWNPESSIVRQKSNV